MWTKSDLRFQLRRVSGLLRILLTNRRATIGLILLTLFAFAALASPLIAPVAPSAVAAGSVAQPEWVTNFPDGYYLSKNMVVISDPNFASPAAIQALTLVAQSTVASNLFLSYDSTARAPGNSQGSLQMAYFGKGPGNASIVKTFQYPYRGPPKRFEAFLAAKATGGNQTIHLRLFVTRGTDSFNLVNTDLRVNGQWSIYTAADFQAPPGVTSTELTPAQIIFSSQSSYTFGLEVDYPGTAQVSIGNIQLNLLGTAYGLMGADFAGHDMWSQDVYGARISLFVGLVATAIGIGLGLVIGLLAGFLGRLVDETLMRFTDMMLVIPGLPLLIVLVSVLGQNLLNVIIIIGFLGWMGFARIVRSQVLTLRERPFVEAAKAAGSGNMRIITRHIFPNIVSLTYVNLALAVPAAILTEAALAFLGLSDPTVISWGNIYQQAEIQGALGYHPPPWWWLVPPGLGIAGVSLAFILVGFALDEIFNPRLRRRR